MGHKKNKKYPKAEYIFPRLLAFCESGARHRVPKEVWRNFAKPWKRFQILRFSVVYGIRKKTGYGDKYSKKEGKNLPDYFSGVCLDNIYFDTRFNIILACKNYAVANLGFEAFEEGSKNVILVRQLQGVKVRNRAGGNNKKSPRVNIAAALKGFRWEKFLLHILLEYAFNNGFDEVRVQSAEENTWYKNRTDSAKRIFRIRYDKTPLRMGFKKHESGEYTYIKKEDFEPIEL